MVPTFHTYTLHRFLASMLLDVKAFWSIQTLHPIRALAPWLTLTLLLTLVGCASHPKNQAKDSQTAPAKLIHLNAHYKNTALSFSMRFDESWHFLTEQAVNKSQDKDGALTIESSSDERQVATISRFPPDQPSQFNDNLTITAEQVTLYPNVQSSSEYLALLKDTLRKAQTGINFDNLHTTKLGSTEYAVLPMSYNIYGIKIHQSHYVTIRKGKIINFILTYAVRNRKPDLLSMLNSVRFLEE